MTTFKAITVEQTGGAPRVAIVDMDEGALMDGDVTVRVSHSTLNYKDALALTGKAPILRRSPMIPGIDFAGVVERSTHAGIAPGDAVLLTGFGVGEGHFGGLAGMARVDGDWLVPLPATMSAAQAMAIGTAGFTAMLCVMALERQGATPADGPVVVTGAAGGVGSVAIALLARAGWHVIASTGRAEEDAYLRRLGAAEVIDRATLSAPGKPLAKERFAAGVDCVGSHTLANVLAATKRRGAVAACGLAQGMDLPTSVAPFILRGVTLVGVDSVLATRAERLEAWDRLARELDPALLATMTRTVPLADVPGLAEDVLAGKVRGRLVVET